MAWRQQTAEGTGLAEAVTELTGRSKQMKKALEDEHGKHKSTIATAV